MRKRAMVVFREKAEQERPQLHYVTMDFNLVTVNDKKWIEFVCPGCNTQIRLPVKEVSQIIRWNRK